MGRATATPNLAPRRSRVEQEILRCAAIGEAADFTGAQWKRVKRVDGRVVVSGKFLADLWLATAGVRVHPTGLSFRGLHVDGEVWINYARIDAQLRSPLVSFHAFNCTFLGGIWIAHARCESLSFHDCRIIERSQLRVDDTGGVPDRTVFSAIFGIGAEIVGMLRIAQCEIGGDLTLPNSVIDDEVLITDSSFAGAINLSGSELRAGLKILRSSMAQESDYSIRALGSIIGGEVVIEQCRMRGGINLGLAQTRPMQFINCRLGAAGLSLRDTQLDGRLLLQDLRCRGPVSLYGARMSALLVARSVVNGMFDLRGSSIAGDFAFQQSRVRTGFYANACAVAGLTFIWDSRIVASANSEDAFGIANSRLGQVELIGLTIEGILTFEDAQFAGLSFTSVAIRPPPMFDPAVHTGHQISTKGARARFSSDLRLSGVSACGEINLREIEVGGILQIKNSWIGNDHTCWSLELAQARVRSLVQLDDCVLPGALSMSGMQAQEVQFQQCRIGAGSARSIETGFGIWAENIFVKRCVAFDGARYTDAGACVVHGAVVLSGAAIGSYVEIARLHVSTVMPAEDKSAIALTFKDSTIGSNLGIGNVVARLKADEAACTFEGAIVLDGLATEKVTLGASLAVSARGSDLATTGDRDGPRLTDRKHGVALSARNSTIGQRTVISARSLAGVVDLRDSALGALSDRGGKSWGEAGVPPGQLFIDGATYSGLDDNNLAGSVGAAGSTAHPHGAVARRLDWLAMQYPNGEPDASSFTPQPYEQLARHYAAMGDERARRQVLVRKRQLQRTHSGLGWIERTVSGLLGLTSDYGYSPGKASIASALVIALGALAAWGLHSSGAIAPAGDEAGSALFSPLLFALDVAVPFLDLGHDSLWRIDPTALPAWPGRTLTMGLAEALYRLAGLVMLSITVLTFSGILHEKE